LVVVNPRSRHGSEVFDTVVRAFTGFGERVIGGRTDEPGALGETIRRRCLEVDRVVIGGGDGTLNRAIPALLECGRPFGIIPLGTANDLARTLGLPQDVREAAEIIVQGGLGQIDVGCVNGKHFLNVASIGLGPKVTKHLSESMKARLGVLGYLRALLSAYRECEPFRACLVVDGQFQRVRSIHIGVGNGRHYGGGATVFEGAAIDDGRLDVFSLSSRPFWQLVLLAPWLNKGRHHVLEAVELLHGETVTVETKPRMVVSADGELLTNTPAQFQVVPKALTVFVPRRPQAGADRLQHVAE
jgi:diacylglycerol kinase (ATP)